MTAITSIQFLAHYDLKTNDFPGASQFHGGYEPLDIAGLPSDLAATLIASGIAKAAPTITPPTPPTMVHVCFLHDRVIEFHDGSGGYPAHYAGGDRLYLPQPVANYLIAEGTAMAIS